MEPDDHLSIKACCRLAGGSEKPLHQSTIYRLVAKGLWPKPVHIGASSRWLRVEVEAALAKMMEARS